MTFFVAGVASEIDCRKIVESTESTYIPYVGVKVNLYEQTEY